MINLFSLFKKKSEIGNVAPMVLLVLDGWGIAPPSSGNPMEQAKTPTMNRLKETYPMTELIASGESVGLPANEVGNTEVGHLTLGAGRVILQDLQRINEAITKRTFFQNSAFIAAASHVRQYHSKLHLMGIFSSENVHGARNHLYALLEFCKLQQIDTVVLHIFTDGRDSAPREALETLTELENRLKSLGIGTIATIAGRYYGMDRDGRWERIEKAYRAIVEGVGVGAASIKDALEFTYSKNLSDEFVQPVVIGEKKLTIDDNDAVIFFNFRIDRARQLTLSFVYPDFENLKSFEFGYVSDMDKGHQVKFDQTFKRVKKPKNVFFVTMTEYQKNMPVSAVAFGPQEVVAALPVVLADANKCQLRLSESEKERFVTYYFSGLREYTLKGEDREIVPSSKVSTYDKKPEMAVFDIVNRLRRILRNNKYHFIIINFANPDMVAHTGNIPATIKALEATDKAINEVVTMVQKIHGTVLITADHGNAEELLTYPLTSFFYTTATGSMNTGHSTNPVPLIIVKEGYKNARISVSLGSLCDVAPTILALMGLAVPPEMTGKNLLARATGEK